MQDYTHNDYPKILELIEKYRKKYGTRSILNGKINEWMKYPSLLSYLGNDRIKIENGNEETRCNEKGDYGNQTIHKIIEKLMNGLGIPESYLSGNNPNFELNVQDAKKFASDSAKNSKKKVNKIIYLVGSTYQGQQLNITPRSIFEIDLNKKSVKFHYQASEKDDMEVSEGSASGNHLFYMIFQEDKEYKKMYILKKGTKPWSQIKYLKGTYIGDDGDNPMAGAIFCEAFDDFDTAKSKLHKLVDTSIQYQLLYTQIKEKGKILSNEIDFKKHHFSKAAQEIKNKYAGNYYGLYLSNPIFHSILQCKLVIKPSGAAIFYGEHTPREGEVGWAYIDAHSKKCHLRFKYNEKLDIFKYYMALNSVTEYHIFGSFGGDSKEPKIPESGRIIFLKVNDEIDSYNLKSIDVENEDDLDKFLATKSTFKGKAIDFLKGLSIMEKQNHYSDTPSLIFGGTSFSNNSENQKNLFSPHNELKVLPDFYANIFRGYIAQYLDKPPHYKIQKIAVRFQKNGSVIARSKNRKYNGKAVKYEADKKLYFSLSYLNEQPEIFHVVQRVDWEDGETVLCGTYTGTGKTNRNEPIGGRIILKKESNQENIDAIELRDFSLSIAKDMEELSKLESGILDYFLGRKDNMIEGYNYFHKSNFLPISQTPKEKIKAQVAGYYLSFRIRTDLKTVSVVPIKIDNWGNVKMKSTQKRDSTEYREYSGICNINNTDIVSLQFHNLDKKMSFAQTLFSKSSNMVDEQNNRIFMGMFLSSNTKKGRVFSCKQILVYQGKDSSEYKNQLPQTINITFLEQPPLEDYELWNNKEGYEGILNYLVGDEYNMIRMSSSPTTNCFDDKRGFNKKIDYGLLYFIAAIQYLEYNDISTLKKLLRQAILNGVTQQKINEIFPNHTFPKIHDLIVKYSINI